MGFAKVRESIEPYYQHWLNPSMQGCSVASVYEKLQPVCFSEAVRQTEGHF